MYRERTKVAFALIYVYRQGRFPANQSRVLRPHGDPFTPFGPIIVFLDSLHVGVDLWPTRIKNMNKNK